MRKKVATKQTERSRNHQMQIFSNSNGSMVNVPIICFFGTYCKWNTLVFNRFVLIFAKYKMLDTWWCVHCMFIITKASTRTTLRIVKMLNRIDEIQIQTCIWINGRRIFCERKRWHHHYHHISSQPRKNLVTITKPHNNTNYMVYVSYSYYKRLPNVPHWMVDKFTMCASVRVFLFSRNIRTRTMRMYWNREWQGFDG